MHGKVTPIRNDGTGVFCGLPERFLVTRYHSLIVDRESVPADWRIDAVAEDGAVMGISHKEMPLYGVQFHPEACPGPQDSSYLFDRFMDMMGGNK